MYEYVCFEKSCSGQSFSKSEYVSRFTTHERIQASDDCHVLMAHTFTISTMFTLSETGRGTENGNGNLL